MANGNIITSLKDGVIDQITHDDDLFNAIDPDKSVIENGGDLINTHIFRYNKNPNTITKAITFLTVLVDITYRDRNETFVTPVLTIWIYSHNDHMDINNIADVYDNRNDYISKLIDLKFNGATKGIGTLKLSSNIEGTYNESFLYRRMIFKTIDLNNSMCEV